MHYTVSDIFISARDGISFNGRIFADPKETFYMIKKMTILIAMVAIVALATAMSGCTSTSPTVSPTATAAANGTASQTSGSGSNVAPAASVSGSTTTIVGSRGGDVNVEMSPSGYLITVTSGDGNVEMSTSDMNILPESAASLEPSGSYVLSFAKQWFDAGSTTFTVKASTPYTITLTKLPQGSPVVPPQTFTGKGEKALGPITLKAGSATFSIKSSDLKQAGFTVELTDGISGSSAGIVASNVDSGNAQNTLDTQETYIVPAAGDYYIAVTANSGASWEVDVSQ